MSVLNLIRMGKYHGSQAYNEVNEEEVREAVRTLVSLRQNIEKSDINLRNIMEANYQNILNKFGSYHPLIVKFADDFEGLVKELSNGN